MGGTGRMVVDFVRLVAPGADGGGGGGGCGVWVVVVVGGDDGCDNADSCKSRRS